MSRHSRRDGYPLVLPLSLHKPSSPDHQADPEERQDRAIYSTEQCGSMRERLTGSPNKTSSTVPEGSATEFQETFDPPPSSLLRPRRTSSSLITDAIHDPPERKQKA